MSTQVAPVHAGPDDPLLLRDLIARTQQHGKEHELPSVVVGFAAPEGDRLFPDFVAYLESELRVEDAIFRLTRERALLFLTDVDETQAGEVIERLRDGFRREFPSLGDDQVQTRFLEISPAAHPLSVRDVLPEIFGAPEA